MDNTKDEVVFKLLDFVCDHFGHNGSGGVGAGRSITDLIEFCERNDNRSNCGEVGYSFSRTPSNERN